MLGRGRTGVTYSFVLICHQNDDYWSFRPISGRTAVAYATFGGAASFIMLSRLRRTSDALM